MNAGIPIGGVCLYLGKAAVVSDDANPVWSAQDDAGSGAAANDAPAAGAGATALIEAMGWMVCDGRTLKISAFPCLYAVLGTLYGGDAPGTFRLPDLRGVFVRGVDHGAGADPDTEQRLHPNGSDAYAGVGSMQLDALQSHCHKYDKLQNTSASGNGSSSYNGPFEHTSTSGPQKEEAAQAPPVRFSADETRPRNVAVYYIIRYA